MLTLNTIQVQTDEDIKACVACIKKAFDPVARKYNLTPDNAPNNGAFLDFGKLKSEMHKGLILFCLSSQVDGQKMVIGTIGIKETKAGEWTLLRLAVDPDFQGQKIGAGLIQYVEKHIKRVAMKMKTGSNAEPGSFTLKLGCIAEDKTLVAFYEKNGYTTQKIKAFKKLPHKVCFMKKKVTL